MPEAAEAARGIPHVIPEREDQRERRAKRGGGRPPKFDREAYRRRNVVERCVGRLKQWRGVATRYEKRAANYRAMVLIRGVDDLAGDMIRQTRPSRTKRGDGIPQSPRGDT